MKSVFALMVQVATMTICLAWFLESPSDVRKELLLILSGLFCLNGLVVIASLGLPLLLRQPEKGK